MSFAITDDPGHRRFSEDSHASGKWQTSAVMIRNRFIRLLWNLSSFKRKGVDKLASGAPPEARVLDLGAGNGAYAYWYLGKSTPAILVATNWSYSALLKIVPTAGTLLLRVCADIRCLPFKPESFSIVYSIDTFGHVAPLGRVLDEILRVSQDATPMFLHSECSDYQYRWPDSMLIKRNGRDIPAQFDGHTALQASNDLYDLYHQRFLIRSFFSPAGLFGWVLGYPEKYRPAFKQARLPVFVWLTTLFALIKKTPLLGVLLRMLNACTNRCELYLGLYGGGSCFADAQKPDRRAGKSE